MYYPWKQWQFSRLAWEYPGQAQGTGDGLRMSGNKEAGSRGQRSGVVIRELQLHLTFQRKTYTVLGLLTHNTPLPNPSLGTRLTATRFIGPGHHTFSSTMPTLLPVDSKGGKVNGKFLCSICALERTPIGRDVVLSRLASMGWDGTLLGK